MQLSLYSKELPNIRIFLKTRNNYYYSNCYLNTLSFRKIKYTILFVPTGIIMPLRITSYMPCTIMFFRLKEISATPARLAGIMPPSIMSVIIRMSS